MVAYTDKSAHALSEVVGHALQAVSGALEVAFIYTLKSSRASVIMCLVGHELGG